MTMGAGDCDGGGIATGAGTTGVGVTVGVFAAVGDWSFLPQAANPQIVNKQRVR